ncbi:hypothetical protein [Adhaeretor mobilis]|uniref:Uncharacterized protein n=1 Tax=Adhaeretor mobilis TaxID=1930276 RepID=A0A517MYX6_9BACT|nr:hypothetical protein [Adhaeretor mobilis]QDT00091.1 hypothetical protein HG15A2_34260 [Adhaeretor mobilis]
MPDVLFKITCVTCNARLSVRNAAVIGQILSCPKCGSMVEVAPPAEADAGDCAKAEGAGLPEYGDDKDASHGAEASPASAHVVGDFETNALGINGESNSSVESATGANQEIDDAMPQAVDLAARYRVIAWASTGLLALVAGVGLMLYTISGNGSDQSDEAETALLSAPLDVKEPTPATAPKATTPPTPPVETNTLPAVAETITPPETSEPAVEDSSPESEPAETNLPTEPLPPEESTKTVVTDATAPAPPKRTLRIDPLDLDPEGFDLSTLQSDSASELSVSPAETSKPPEQPLQIPAATAERPTVSRDPAQQLSALDAPAVLAKELQAFVVNAMPLCEFLDFTTRMTAVPVSVTPAELRLAAVSATRSVSVSVKDASIDSLLSAALKPLRLTPVIENNQILLQRGGLEDVRTIEYPVADLLDSHTDAAKLATMVRQLVAPETWTDASPEGPFVRALADQLQVLHQEKRQYEVLRLLETLRLARGLEPRSKYPVALLVARSPHMQLNDRLSAPATFTFSHYTPTCEVFRFWQNELGLALLIDWPALATVDIEPRTRITCSSNDKPWHEALDDSLTPLGLSWRAVDGRTLQITSIEVASQSPQLEFYSLKSTVKLHANQVEDHLDRLTKDTTLVFSPEVYIDKGSNTLVVRHSSAAQRKLAQWLTEQGFTRPTSE